jgi:hypothetical protein
MNSSVFSGAFALFLLFWLATGSGNWPAAVFVVASAGCGWVVNMAVEYDRGDSKVAQLVGVLGALGSVACGLIAFASVAVRVLG